MSKRMTVDTFKGIEAWRRGRYEMVMQDAVDNLRIWADGLGNFRVTRAMTVAYEGTDPAAALRVFYND